MNGTLVPLQMCKLLLKHVLMVTNRQLVLMKEVKEFVTRKIYTLVNAKIQQQLDFRQLQAVGGEEEIEVRYSKLVVRVLTFLMAGESVTKEVMIPITQLQWQGNRIALNSNAEQILTLRTISAQRALSAPLPLLLFLIIRYLLNKPTKQNRIIKIMCSLRIKPRHLTKHLQQIRQVIKQHLLIQQRMIQHQAIKHQQTIKLPLKIKPLQNILLRYIILHKLLI